MSENLIEDDIKQLQEAKAKINDNEQVVVFSNEKQKFKLMKLGNKVYEINCNYGERSFKSCLIDMYLSKQ